MLKVLQFCSVSVNKHGVKRSFEFGVCSVGICKWSQEKEKSHICKGFEYRNQDPVWTNQLIMHSGQL